MSLTKVQRLALEIVADGPGWAWSAPTRQGHSPETSRVHPAVFKRLGELGLVGFREDASLGPVPWPTLAGWEALGQPAPWRVLVTRRDGSWSSYDQGTVADADALADSLASLARGQLALVVRVVRPVADVAAEAARVAPY